MSGALARLALAALLLGACVKPENQATTFEHRAMGTLFKVHLKGDPEVAARQAAADAAFARLDELDALLSDYKADSELSQLSRSSDEGGPIVVVSRDLLSVLSTAQDMARASRGAFDITIGPLSRIWRRAFRQEEVPEASEIDTARNLVDHRNLSLDLRYRTAQLDLPGMRLDLGGIGKGYALDAMAEVLRERDYDRFVIDGGGDLLFGRDPKGFQFFIFGWGANRSFDTAKVPIDGVMPLRVWGRKRAVATSGDTYRYLEADGKRYSHIIDPRTGYGITERIQVTAIARTGALADAAASAISVMGAKEGLRWANRQAGIEAIVVTWPNGMPRIEGTEHAGRYAHGVGPRTFDPLDRNRGIK